MTAFARHRPSIGLVLGSGSARGWAHIGVLRALLAAGIRPDIVCGASIGAVVGAAYATDQLDPFEDWVRGMDRRRVMSYLDFRLSGGMLKGERLIAQMSRHFDSRPIEELAIPFAAVATDLYNGDEVWLRRGRVTDAIRASFALPGLFTPVWHDGRLLVDGGVVNPVPVSLARALGAEVVIAVDLNHDRLSRWTAADQDDTSADREADESSLWRGQNWVHALQQQLGALWPGSSNERHQPPPMPSMLSVITDSIHVMQVRITRSRMAGDPPDAVIAPSLAHLKLLDFDCADEAIAAGQQATEAALPSLQWLAEANAKDGAGQSSGAID